MGARRVADGPCSPGRGLYVRSGAIWSDSLVGDSTRTRTFSASLLASEGAPFRTTFSPFEQVEWVGDTSSYVDVFFDASFDEGFAGEEFAPFVRYHWVPGAWDVLSFPEREMARTPLPPQVPVGRPTAIRHYDRGACSASLSWRELATALVDGLDRAVTNGFAELSCGEAAPIGNWVITPVLRLEFVGTSLDGFRLTRSYRARFCDLVGDIFRVQILGRLGVDGRRLIFRADDLRVEGLAAGAVQSALETRFENAVNEGLAIRSAQPATIPGTMPPVPLVPCALRAGADDFCLRGLRATLPTVPDLAARGLTASDIQPRNAVCLPDATSPRGGVCGIRPNFHRLHGRPEGYEFVLSEWDPDEELAGRGTADPLYPLLDMGGLCDRTSPPAAPVQTGYMGSVFEIPPRGTPLPFGDTP